MSVDDEVYFFEHDVPHNAPTKELEAVFETRMCNSNVLLLSSWGNYKESMPVRKHGGTRHYFRLRNLPFHASEDSIEKFAMSLEDSSTVGHNLSLRDAVAYLSAVSSSGKTASILPAFLNSHRNERDGRFSHYLYMPFSNNANKNFCSDEFVDDNAEIAKKQGAVFMYRCMERLLRCEYGDVNTRDVRDCIKGSVEVSIDDPSDPSIQVSGTNNPAKKESSIAFFDRVTRRINQLLNDKIPGKHERFLVHLDEHRKMNDNPNFRHGAMVALAKCYRVKCVATYTEPVDYISPAKSSGVCRQPLVHVPFDLCDYLKYRFFVNIGRLVGLPGLDEMRKRKWATLAFRMAAKAHADCPLSLICPNPTRDWLEQIQAALIKFDAKTGGMGTMKGNAVGIEAFDEALADCFAATVLPPPDNDAEHNEFALKLMNGVTEAKFRAEQFGNTSVTCGLTILKTKVVASWHDLLTLRYDSLPAFEIASRRFAEQLTVDDYLSGSPLEEAYGWSLLCRSAVQQQFDFRADGFSFNFKAEDYQIGRLFRASAANNGEEMVDPRTLKKGVLYRAAEGKRYNDALKRRRTLNVAGEPVDAAGNPMPTTDRSGSVNHPLCDFFFNTNDDKLVLIDITGGKNAPDLYNKAKSLDEWIVCNEPELIKKRRGKCMVQGVYGVVLAPFVDAKGRGGLSTFVYQRKTNQVLLVCGSDAIDMLGALGQLTEWLDVTRIPLTRCVTNDDVAGDQSDGSASNDRKRSATSMLTGRKPKK
eukprot:CAMPEP_0119561892 /NCGR_PEP_ID=MMETSP1352-20130426/18955_1 /TAXON_ID=265584 /ORGANISM="Stauroneis constricta, Strain CCMP1120" /LENGTH=756 /DNA_ID=CAMNT_0007610201 /DNA_START=232 /DNA_END=2502 /DNA_ORIENTATION=-